MAAFLPRLAAINRYVTPDELIWVFRSVQFRQAFLAGQWAETLTAGHPGVITTWLGAWGISLQLWLLPSDLAAYQWLTHLAWFAPENSVMFQQLYTFLTGGRLLIAIVNSLGVVAIFVLAQPLFGRAAAVLVAGLLAFDPFLVGLSGLLHVDALLATFATLSLLALAQAITLPARPFKWAALSGALAGLAILTKTPALLLPPFAAFIIFLSMFADWPRPFASRLMRMIGQGLSWLAACLVLVFLLFPALWHSPMQVAEKMTSTSSRHIEEALRPIFFLGRSAYEHGPLFYPLTLAFRLNPIVFCGLILAMLLIIRAIWRRENHDPWLKLKTWIFIAWPLLFLAAISLAVKKFDRYALPVIPALTIIAALGWVYVPALYMRRNQVVLALVGGQLLLLLWVMPYPLTAVNPLLGGPAVARHVFDVGWGEAESTAARWLATQPDAATQTAVSWIAPAVAPFFPGQTLPSQESSFPFADYLIVPANGRDPQPTTAQLLHTIQFNGRDRAYIYQQPEPEPILTPGPLAAPVTFGNGIQMVGTGTAVYTGQLETVIRWQLLRSTSDRYTVKLTLRDDQGQLWASREMPLLNAVYFYPAQWAANEPTDTRYTVALPPGLPPGTYQLAVTLFAEATQAQLPVFTADGTFQGMAQSLGQFQTQLPPQPAIAPDFDPPIARLQDWQDGRLRLLAPNDFPPSAVVNGDVLWLDLVWRADETLPAGLQVELTLGDVVVRQPLSRFDTGNWRPGEMIHEKTAVPIPPDMPGDVYTLGIRPLTADGQSWGDVATVGQVKVIALDREFTLPAAVPIVRDDSFGGQMRLRGLETPQPDALTLYWQVEQVPDQPISAFVHLLDENGQIVAQSDQWPGGLPAHLWAIGQIISDHHTLSLPPDLPPGAYQMAVGLYDPATGQRLPAFAADGRAHANDQILLPVEVTE